VSRYVFKLPDLGEGTVEAEIVGWRVKPGDTVAEDDVIVEVMTEKAAVELPAPVGGRVLSTTGTPGDMVAVGAELIVFETDAGAATGAAPSTPTPVAGAEAPRASGEATQSTGAAGGRGGAAGERGGAAGERGAAGDRGATAAGGVAGDGDQVGDDGAGGRGVPGDGGAVGDRGGAGGRGAAGDGGTVGDRGGAGGRAAAGDGGRAGGRSGAAGERSGTAGDRTGVSGDRGGAAGAHAAPVARGAASTPAASGSAAPRGNGATNGHAHNDRPGRVATSPAIRRRAHEAGVDLSQLSGSGPNGRILRQDFEAFVSSRSGPKLVRSRPAEHRVPTSEPATEEIKVIGVRRVIAQRMSEAKRNIPHFAYVEEFDITELESLRRHLNSKLESGTLTYLPFIVSALVRVLRDFPQCNAQYDSERGVIIRHRAVHVGVATQTPDGLKVPVVREAQSLSLWEVAAQIRRVTEAARANKATRDELSGSTITVTSLGKLGGIASTPIINAPEVSIIGINRAVERPMVYDGAIAIRRMMNLSSSFDHRFVDGHDAAAMIQALKERIEHPATIFID
jgi:2-oxoisovalerate dehydrogenase E2 component (dihydrolipoyl transacylase)